MLVYFLAVGQLNHGAEHPSQNRSMQPAAFWFICLIACWSKAILESAPNSLVQLYALVIWAIPEGFEDELAMFWLWCTCAVIFSGRCTCKYCAGPVLENAASLLRLSVQLLRNQPRTGEHQFSQYFSCNAMPNWTTFAHRSPTSSGLLLLPLCWTWPCHEVLARLFRFRWPCIAMEHCSWPKWTLQVGAEGSVPHFVWAPWL